MEKIVVVTQELNKLFDKFNNAKFNNELEKPIISIQSDHRGKTRGWCTVDKVWDDDSSEKYEIAITAEFLNRTYEEICGTMLHEIVHLYNILRGVKDCSNNNQYHNKKFKETAEQFGLIVEKSDKRGWSQTKLNEENKILVNSFNIDKEAFKLFRKLKMKEPVEKTPTYVYTCEKCGVKFSLKKDLNLNCGLCKNPFIKEEKTGKANNG
jgi:DNA-directed RNA polymerase subunit RPC12/RpoP